MQKANYNILLGIGIVIIALFLPKILDSVKNIDTDPSVPIAPVIPQVPCELSNNSELINIDFEPVKEPSAEMKVLTADIPLSVTGEDANWDKVRLAQFYAQLSSIIMNEPGFIRTTGDFRDYYMQTGQINFAGNSLKGKYADLGKVVDDIIVKSIGKQSKEFDNDTRNKVSNIFAAISWSLYH